MNCEIAVCIASGPSLKREDCDRVRGRAFVITVNNSWQMAPWCDVIFAADDRWWRVYGDDVPPGPARWSIRANQQRVSQYGINLYPGRSPPNNSGERAIALAKWMGAKQIYLLGYDCKAGRKMHWHSDHKGCSNPRHHSVMRWRVQFQRMARSIQQGYVINLSRDTALSCFPRARLEDVFPHGRIEVLRQSQQESG